MKVGKPVVKARATSTAIAEVHRWLGYIVVILAQPIVFTGYMHYVSDYAKAPNLRFLAFVNAAVFFVSWGIAELIYRCWRRRHHIIMQVPSDAGLKKWTPEEVD